MTMYYVNSSLFLLVMLVFLYDVIICDVINAENLNEILKYFL